MKHKSISYALDHLEGFDRVIIMDADNTVSYTHLINYLEQTKAIAISFADFENRCEETARRIKSSSQLIEGLEQYMQTRIKLVETNDEFIKALEDISKINGKITEIEIFTTEDAQDKDLELLKFKENLKNAEKKVATLTEAVYKRQSLFRAFLYLNRLSSS